MNLPRLTKHTFPAILTLCLLYICQGLFEVLRGAGEATQLTIFMVGQFFAFLSAAVAYWVGTTRASSDKTDAMKPR